MSKSKRLLELMHTVQSRKTFTVRSLADEFGVSYRTMLRDLQELGELGVPLYSELGAGGGYRVLPERSIPPIHWGGVSTRTLKTLGLRGRSQSQPEILERGAFHVIGLSFTGLYSQLVNEMPKLWAEFLERCDEIQSPVNHNVWLDVAQENHITHTFTQYVSMEVSDFRVIPPGMVGLTVPAQHYAVFTHIGSMDQVEETYYTAFQWMDEHGLKRLPNALRFELYDHRYIPPLHPRDCPTNAYDIYFPIHQ